MTAHKYMVAVDSSQEAHTALEWTVNHSTKEDQILILTIVERALLESQIKEQVMKRAKELLQECAHFCKKNGINCKPYLIDDATNVREEIIQQVEKKQPDFLVVGNRGLGALERTSVGSISDYAVRYSPVPVVVVKYSSIV